MDNLFGNVSLEESQGFLDIPDKTGEELPVKDEVIIKDKNEPDDGFIEVQVGSTHKKDSEEDDDDFKPDGFVEIDDETPPSKTKGSSSSSPYKPFAKALSEEGFLPSFEDEDFDKLVEELGGETEALMELSRRSIVEEIDNYKKDAEDDFKAFLEARDSGLDLNQWADVYEAKKAYAGITDDKIEEDEELQKSLISENLRYRGFTAEEVADTIESYETTGKLSDNAKKALKNLIKVTDQQEAKIKEDKVAKEKAAIEAREKNLANLKKEVDTMSEIIPGIKINKQTKDKIYSSITTPVKTGPNGEQYNAAMVKRSEDPLKYAIIENYLIELGVFDGKWDKVIAHNKTRAVVELEKKLSESKNTNFKSGKNTLGSGGSDDDIDFNLGSFKTK